MFGADAQQFNPYRFLHNKSLAKSLSFRPFGGGKTYCPGRYLAEREILTFVALAIYRFDIALTKEVSKRKGGGKEAPSQDFPSLNTKKFCLGLMEPVKGNDLLVNVQKSSFWLLIGAFPRTQNLYLMGDKLPHISSIVHGTSQFYW